MKHECQILLIKRNILSIILIRDLARAEICMGSYLTIVVFCRGYSDRQNAISGGLNGNGENGETPQVSGAPGSAASRRWKTFPDESLPDLIRLVRNAASMNCSRILVLFSSLDDLITTYLKFSIPCTQSVCSFK